MLNNLHTLQIFNEKRSSSIESFCQKRNGIQTGDFPLSKSSHVHRRKRDEIKEE